MIVSHIEDVHLTQVVLYNINMDSVDEKQC